MQTSGYSDKPLIEKLGYKPGDIIYVKDAPVEFIKHLQSNILGVTTAPSADWAHVFFIQRAKLEQFLRSANLDDIEKGFWVSWPKKSSKVTTDLTEQIFRDLILPLGWVDTKVCAIDDTWSGLKFLRRKESEPKQ